MLFLYSVLQSILEHKTVLLINCKVFIRFVFSMIPFGRSRFRLIETFVYE